MTKHGCGALVVGSFNQAKAAELVELLSDLKVIVRRLSEFPKVQPVSEDGETFAENARLKAIGLARQIMQPGLIGVVADDSGIEVDALGGRPGVHSARYVSESATDPERVQHLLEELGDLPPEQRTARFRGHVVLADGECALLESEGKVEGTISFAAAGTSGFGYDPIFIPAGHDQTFAQLGAEVKHKISHRAVALRGFHEALLKCMIVKLEH